MGPVKNMWVLTPWPVGKGALLPTALCTRRWSPQAREAAAKVGTSGCRRYWEECGLAWALGGVMLGPWEPHSTSRWPLSSTPSLSSWAVYSQDLGSSLLSPFLPGGPAASPTLGPLTATSTLWDPGSNARTCDLLSSRGVPRAWCPCLTPGCTGLGWWRKFTPLASVWPPPGTQSCSMESAPPAARPSPPRPTALGLSRRILVSRNADPASTVRLHRSGCCWAWVGSVHSHCPEPGQPPWSRCPADTAVWMATPCVHYSCLACWACGCDAVCAVASGPAPSPPVHTRVGFWPRADSALLEQLQCWFSPPWHH
ncbi:uncharacterized protein LOC117284333 [Fukomys damarensis]|uniref:uncharacterized protein LOC117284333 n=1 Tax=Fukomys damarensis TaxID=885580 RepID=UPI001455B638|nr:uncharacterized protein LOC117284333 [Fukomys damarensis]XP_033615009.1 uncharacterized protein LOC117284333 [Fukomys damarensis]